MYLEKTKAQGLLYALCGKSGSFSPVTQGACYLGLFTALPENAEGTDGTEVSPSATNNYARVNIADANIADMDSVYTSKRLGRTTTTADRTCGNKKEIKFNAAVDRTLADPSQSTASSAWGTIKGIGLFTSATGGTPFAWGKLVADITVPQNNSFHMLPGWLEIYLDDAGNIAANAVAAAQQA